jgi:hypothetical protein
MITTLIIVNGVWAIFNLVAWGLTTKIPYGINAIIMLLVILILRGAL